MPSVATLELAAFLKCVGRPADAMLPSRLGDIQVTPHSGMAAGQPLASCELALALIASTNKCELRRFGAGYRLVIKGVRDFALTMQPVSGDGEDVDGELVSICTLEDVTQYKLDPPRAGKSQHALVLVSGMTPGDTSGGLARPKSFMVERVQMVPEVEVSACQKALAKLAFLSASTEYQCGPRGKVQWSSEDTPLKAKKARRLSASPSDVSMTDGT